MKSNRISLLMILLAFITLASSCSSSRSYADRKRAKYSKKTYADNTRKRTKRTAPRTTTHSKTNRTATTVSGVRSDIINNAKKHIGTRYVYGGKKPGGFDCSGFTSYVFEKSGVTLSGPSHSQSKQGVRLSKSQLKAGDLIFFGKGSKVSHVGIIAEAGPRTLKVIHSTSSRGVVLENIIDSDYWMRRFLYGRDIVGSGYASN